MEYFHSECQLNTYIFSEILVQDGEESIFVNGIEDAEMSSYQPYFVEPGAVGFAFQNAKDWGIKISGAEVCSCKFLLTT